MNRRGVMQVGRRWVEDMVTYARNVLRALGPITSGHGFSTDNALRSGDDPWCGIARTRAAPPVAPAKHVALVILPPLLLASTVPAYRWLGARLGPKKGYFTGFLFYWTGWCLLVPLWVLGPQRMRDLFRDVRPRVGRPAGVELFCLALPPLVGYSFAFPRQLRTANCWIVVTSAALALVNATLEELLWRGAYAAVFPDQVIWGYLYPVAGFAVWHVAPQTIFPSPYPGGTPSFVGTAALSGLQWGWVAWRTGSIRWTTVSHVLFDFSGLGARLYFDR